MKTDLNFLLQKYQNLLPSRGELRARSAFSTPEDAAACQVILDMMGPASAPEEKAITDAMWLGEFDHLIRGTKAFAEIDQMIDLLPWELREETEDHQPEQPFNPAVWVPDEPRDTPQHAAPEDPVVPRPEVPAGPPGVSELLFRQLQGWPPVRNDYGKDDPQTTA
jgi:hypothetical protein